MKQSLRLLVCTLLFTGNASGQSRSTLEDEGYDYLNNAEYAKAYEVFDKLHSRYPNEIDYHFKLGICALNYTEKKNRAIQIFQEMKVQYNTAETEMYLGKAYHRNYKFDEAIVILQPLLEKLTSSKKAEDKDLIPEVQLTLMNCFNGKELIKEKVFADIQNIGPPVNTYELEGVPVITADESTMIYTYVGRKSIGGKLNAELKRDPKGAYLSDIYITTKDATGNWLPGKPVDALNTKGNDAAIAISPDGNMLFTFLSNNENEGDIMVSHLQNDAFSLPVALNSNINTVEYWEGSCSISADSRLLYFSSEKPGGMGARDLYVSEWTDGDWGPAVNLGENINTEFDEDAPFIHPDGKTLFFSSKGHISIGGYDIMFTTKGEDGEWSAPKSMGIPLNTPEDDSYYVINSKGDRGYFSSTRTGSGGYGSQDIYMVTPGILGDKPIVALIKGVLYGDDRPVEGVVEITKEDGSTVATYTSGSVSGRYLATLSPGKSYHIRVSAAGYETTEEDLDLRSLDSYLEQEKDFYLYSQSFAGVQKQSQPIDPEKAEENTGTEPPAEEEVAAVTPPEQPETPQEEEVEEVEEEVAAAAPPQEEEEEEEVVAVTPPVEEPEEEEVIAATPSQPEGEEEEQALAANPEPAQPQEKITPPENVEEKTEPSQPAVAKTFKPSPCSDGLPDFALIKGRSLEDPVVYAELLEKAGDYCSDRLYFTVQVGAFRNAENFKITRIKSLGPVQSKQYPDGITRFTQNEHKTLKQAERLRQKAIKKGVKDAWVIAFVDGQRYTLEDFIMVDFMAQPVN